MKITKIKSKPVIKIHEVKRKINKNTLLLIIFFTGVIVMSATYAWLYASLNVKVDFFKLQVSKETGLFISLDGINYSGSVVISKDILTKELSSIYPNHTSQWADGGLFPVSSVGIRNSNYYKFDMYGSKSIGYDYTKENRRRYLSTRFINEGDATSKNIYIAFDIFLKNVSGSPLPDNLYLDEGTSVSYDNSLYNDADGTINSLRIGFVRMNTTSRKSELSIIQNLVCDNKCISAIYEPNSLFHSNTSINRARRYGINLVDGEYMPTYAVINEGENLELANGHKGFDVPLDKEHFAEQITHTDFKKSLFPIYNGVTKVRVYVWLEGQDIDSLETTPQGAKVSINLNLIKDLAGYE